MDSQQFSPSFSKNLREARETIDFIKFQWISKTTSQIFPWFKRFPQFLQNWRISRNSPIFPTVFSWPSQPYPTENAVQSKLHVQFYISTFQNYYSTSITDFYFDFDFLLFNLHFGVEIEQKILTAAIQRTRRN